MQISLQLLKKPTQFLSTIIKCMKSIQIFIQILNKPTKFLKVIVKNIKQNMQIISFKNMTKPLELYPSW